MRFVRILVTLGILALVSLNPVASATENEGGLRKRFASSNDLRMSQNKVLASKYCDTECVDFSFKKSSEKIGRAHV